MTFEEIAEPVGGLPPSANRWQAWWENHGGAHVQAAAWLEEGWRVVELDLRGRA